MEPYQRLNPSGHDEADRVTAAGIIVLERLRSGELTGAAAITAVRGYLADHLRDLGKGTVPTLIPRLQADLSSLSQEVLAERLEIVIAITRSSWYYVVETVKSYLLAHPPPTHTQES
jgi:hypothetical protein